MFGRYGTIIAVVAVLTTSWPGAHAQAMIILANRMNAAAKEANAVVESRVVCERYWDGYRVRTRCYWVPRERLYPPYPIYRPWRYRYWRW